MIFVTAKSLKQLLDFFPSNSHFKKL